MVKISSYVFFDLETTGLPHQEKNKTKIIEISFVAASRKDIEEVASGSQIHVSKLTLLFNPLKKIDPAATILTGIDNDSLKNAPIFKERTGTIINFLNELPKPVCLVAHNGNRFDYKILLAEFSDANVNLPKDLLCVDSLTGFRTLHKEKERKPAKKQKRSSSLNMSYTENSIVSENWPELDISKEDWNEIDSLCSSFSSIPLDDSQNSIILDESDSNNTKQDSKLSFTLTNIYKRLVKTEIINAHRAEDDCLMLMECVIATKEFLPWADKYCKNIHDIQPLDRNRYTK